jgi:molecular chaperone DnaK
MARNFFEQEPRTDIDPDLVVALGAAIQGYALSTRTPRESLAIVPGPSKEAVTATLARKEAARAERPDQPAFAPAEQASDDDTSPSNPPPRPRPPSLPTLPEPSASARPARRGTVEYDVQEIAPPPPAAPAVSEPAGFGSETTEELALDFEDLDDLLPPPAPEPKERAGPASPPTPPPPRPAPPVPVAAPASYDASDDDIFSTPFDEMVAELPNVPSPPPSTLVKSAPPPSPPARAPAPVPVVQMAERPPPLLMDVTPHSLGIETVGGYAERIIKRNAPIPIEQTRIFTTAQDDQDTVRVTVCQGESRRFADNQPLGEIELSALRRARRGDVRIEVTFMIDANGTLDVKATDVATGRLESIRINLLGGFDEEAMAEMQARQEATFG